ncbi:serine protease [Pseudonocardia sp. TRM90224]|uniref:serine protease n=1 Tax=Pseudonocardia sp. TRM90224 TaxID=2812678 RepID=UPI001E448278|nr:serine protease [Pseudonocardia sp. TRM90224]
MGRHSIVAASAAALVVLGLAAPSDTIAEPPAPRFASAATATITPGALLYTPFRDDAASACTAGFVFTGRSGEVYLGSAAHCAAAEPNPLDDGCSAAVLPLGTPVAVQASDGAQVRGRLAYSSWLAMQRRGEAADELCALNDFALVEIDPEAVGLVNPTVPEVGGPDGIDTDGADPGETVYSYQPNNGGALRVGVALGSSTDGLAHRVRSAEPGGHGDSGSGYLDEYGRASGVLSTQFVDAARTNGVTDLARALGYANRYGGIGRVALVKGTEYFSPERTASSE